MKIKTKGLVREVLANTKLVVTVEPIRLPLRCRIGLFLIRIGAYIAGVVYVEEEGVDDA